MLLTQLGTFGWTVKTICLQNFLCRIILQHQPTTCQQPEHTVGLTVQQEHLICSLYSTLEDPFFVVVGRSSVRSVSWRNPCEVGWVTRHHHTYVLDHGMIPVMCTNSHELHSKRTQLQRLINCTFIVNTNCVSLPPENTHTHRHTHTHSQS